MHGMGADYWHGVELVVPTHELVIKRQNEDVKFEAFVLDSILTLHGDKVFPQRELEQGLLELRLEACGSGLLFKAYFEVSGYIRSYGNLYTSETNLAFAKLLNDKIRNGKASNGVFGGNLRLGEALFTEPSKYAHLELSKYLPLQLGYAEFPKDSGFVYIFDRTAPLRIPSKF